MSQKIVIERSYQARIEDVWDLWTTKQGFASWWGPQGFRSEVHELERVKVAPCATTDRGHPGDGRRDEADGGTVSHPAHSRFTEVKHHERLVLRNVIDFLPGVEPYESDIAVDFSSTGERVRMVVTLDPMHSEQFSKMQQEGFTSQLTKLDARFA